MVCLIETVEFMPLKLELPFDAEKQRQLHPVSLHNNSHLKNKSVQAFAPDIWSTSS